LSCYNFLLPLTILLLLYFLCSSSQLLLADASFTHIHREAFATAYFTSTPIDVHCALQIRPPFRPGRYHPLRLLGGSSCPTNDVLLLVIVVVIAAAAAVAVAVAAAAAAAAAAATAAAAAAVVVLLLLLLLL
jgi:hypothetical protein